MEVPRPSCWHALPSAEVLVYQDTPPYGLTAEMVTERRARYGPNSVPSLPRRGALMRILLQFHNVLIYVLLASGVVTILLGHTIDAAVIFGVVFINAIIGFVQEGKAERALEAIHAMLSPHAIVLREGRRVQVAVEALVPGDLVLIASGDRVPADLRLTTARNLRIQEAVLTGESLPVEKTVVPVAEDAALAERTCLCFSGTMVAAGQGTGVVIGTGANTEIGRISSLLAGVESLETPLLRQMSVFGRWLAGIILAVSAAVLAFAVLWRGQPVDDAFLAVVGLAVAAIPEGLPAVMTITLAISVTRMAGRNAIVRRLPAVETLGSVTVICTDKTGTLTRNEMTVRSLTVADGQWTVSGEGYAPVGDVLDAGGRPVLAEVEPVLALLAQGSALCADADLSEIDGEWHVSGDPTEAALLSLALKTGLDLKQTRGAYPRLDVIPFESEHRFMASLHHDHAGHVFVYLKGAPEAVLPRCATVRDSTGVQPIDQAAWQVRAEAMAGQGQRVLALAMVVRPEGHAALSMEDVAGDLVLLGLFGLIDPPRAEAVEAITIVHRAGVAVKMITGDHVVTARAIGDQLGLDGADALSGRDLDGLDEAGLRRAAQATSVFARTAPENKLRLVEALQAEGHVVAMTGDGVNDAPALKRADVGVAMGCKGTEAAKEAADMVLADDNFASIAAAVEEGRTVYDNLKKAILFILPTNAGEAFIVIIAILFGLVMPLTTKQILWVNMITAVTLALALAFEAAEKGIMQRPPRPRGEAFLSVFLVWRVVFVSILLTIAVMGIFEWEMLRSNGDHALARTAAVNMLVAGEIVYLWNVRHLHRPVLSMEGLFGSWPVIVAACLVSAFQLLFTYWAPFHRLFETADLGLQSWLAIGGTALVIFLLIEAEKALMRHFQGLRQGRVPRH